MNVNNLSYNEAVLHVRRVRVEKKISQVKMCSLIGMSIGAYNRFETDSNYCNYEVLVKAARKLGLTTYISFG
jgi:transcriptional regulator with XRE-family HTH domain